MTAALDVPALGAKMIDAARAVLAKRGPVLQAAAEMELRRLAGSLADIGSLLAKGDIDPARAQAMVTIHRNALHGVLRTVEGLGILAVEDAMQAVTDVAAATVNRMVGFKLLPERKEQR